MVLEGSLGSDSLGTMVTSAKSKWCKLLVHVSFSSMSVHSCSSSVALTCHSYSWLIPARWSVMNLYLTTCHWYASSTSGDSLAGTKVLSMLQLCCKFSSLALTFSWHCCTSIYFISWICKGSSTDSLNMEVALLNFSTSYPFYDLPVHHSLGLIQ